MHSPDFITGLTSLNAALSLRINIQCDVIKVRDEGDQRQEVKIRTISVDSTL